MNGQTFGRPELAIYMVGRRRVTHVLGMWMPVGRGDAMDKARYDYDRGLVEMCQARWRDEKGTAWDLQYAIPRKKPRVCHANTFGTLRARAS